MLILSKSKVISILEIFVIFILPVLLFTFKIIPLGFEFIALIVFSVLCILVILKDKYSLKQLGFRLDNIKQGFIPYLLFTILGVIFITILALLTDRKPAENIWQYTHFKYLFIPISFLQELGYRGFLIPKLESILSNKIWVLIINVLLFTFLHIFYFNLHLIIPLTFLGGIGFAALYMKYPNLYLVSISHMILNFSAVLFDFFGFREHGIS